MNPCLVLLNLSNMKLSDFQNQAHERTKNVEEQNDQKINIIKLKKMITYINMKKSYGITKRKV